MSTFPSIWSTLDKVDPEAVELLVTEFMSDPEHYSGPEIAKALEAISAQKDQKPKSFGSTRTKEWRAAGFPLCAPQK